MVRSALWAGGSLGYRAAMDAERAAVRMRVEAPEAEPGAPPSPAWTPAAAMVPVPPLAPPPARPGAGRAVAAPVPVQAERSLAVVLVVTAGAMLVAAALVILLLASH